MAPVFGSAKMRGRLTIFAGGCERNLNHVDAVQRRVRVLLRILVRAAGQLLGRARRAGARAVNVDVRRVVGILEQRMRVRAAARLHRRDLLRLLDVGDVEDADAAEPLRADRLLDPGVPQSMRPRVCSTDMISRLPRIETSPCPPGHTTDVISRGFSGFEMS